LTNHSRNDTITSERNKEELPMLKKINTVLSVVVCAVWLSIGVWMFASWCDIVADNCDPNPVHSEYNFFVMGAKRG
jgi:hypothetical protein